MLTDAFDYEKALNVLLYVVDQLGMPGYHQTFKTLYFAEQRSLATYGSAIVGDGFVKMEAGPVPSEIYNMVKIADGRNQDNRLSEGYIQTVRQHLRAVAPHRLQALMTPDLDFLSDTDRECLDAAIEFCRNRSYQDLKDISHDTAWDAASMSSFMDTLKIAAAGGADEVALKYLEEGLMDSSYYAA
ncbi:DUF4065 domain-containing protein [Hymenobacter lapidiphilus]|uniref:Panacea domain-containing protein n=1 Tax=Hymenobacter sp. CCM 8763 TaxID=2303334 RepID=UPI000E3573A4|nr:Panacea domain-containing protein [Hymenobacter sp. CCM 8763]RFP64348.1 DUF4065 domain-containing protein [Hymenobacter sp. CCM 8763]